MKIDRLIGILTILLQQDKVTAPFLAEKFEVSKRTILRDIEDLCKAGLPIVTMQGQNGGISIMEGFSIDRTVFTSSEMQAIIAGINSLTSISNSDKYQSLKDKLSIEESSAYDARQHMYIDLSSYYKKTLAPKIELIQKAIEQQFIITFDYYSPNSKTVRKMEPYLLVFQWSSWYIWGYCLLRQDFRLFKLNRLDNLYKVEEEFQKRQNLNFIPMKKEGYSSGLFVEVLFHPSVKWRLIDEYGIDNFKELENGFLHFKFGFDDKEHFFHWLSSYGSQAELLKPEYLREEYQLNLQEILKIYTNEVNVWKNE